MTAYSTRGTSTQRFQGKNHNLLRQSIAARGGGGSGGSRFDRQFGKQFFLRYSVTIRARLLSLRNSESENSQRKHTCVFSFVRFSYFHYSFFFFFRCYLLMWRGHRVKTRYRRCWYPIGIFRQYKKRREVHLRIVYCLSLFVFYYDGHRWYKANIVKYTRSDCRANNSYKLL